MIWAVFQAWAKLLISSEGSFYLNAVKYTLYASKFISAESPFLFQHDCFPMKSTKTWFDEFGVGELQ